MLTIHLPAPLSLNNAYTRSRHGGRVLTDAARAYKQEVHLRAMAAIAQSPMTFCRRKRYAAEMTVYQSDNRRRDLDNAPKLALDSVCKAAGIDDSQIDEMHLYRKRGAAGAVVVLWELT